MNNNDILSNLRRSVLFEHASDSVLAKIAEIVCEKKISTDEELIRKGDSGDSMYIVCSGKVKVHDGNVLLNHLGNGNVFGEMAALDGEVRTASITAVEDTTLIQLNRDDLSTLCNREPEVAKALIHFLCQRGKNIISDITERSSKLQAMAKEFEIGRNIQAGFLPETLPEIEGWEIAAFFRAAREVAGDFYDVFEIGHRGTIGLIVGDVCGKGVGAALFMTLFRSLLRASMLSGSFMSWTTNSDDQKESDLSGRQILLNSVNLTNNYIAHTHGSACMFATLFVGILDPLNGVLTYINAGHESPIIYNKDGIKTKLKSTGSAVGLFPDQQYEIESVKMATGDFFIAFTDGIIEAVNPDGEQFSEKRMLEIVMQNKNTTDEGLTQIVSNLEEFTAGADQFDDITLLAVSRHV